MGGQKTILVVEDEVLIRMLLAEILREEGYQIIEAASGDEGMAVLRSGQTLDLVITDVRMPGQTNGMQLADYAKDQCPSRPVIMASGHLTAAETSTPDEFIVKPYSFPALLRVVDKLIGPPCQDDDQNRTA